MLYELLWVFTVYAFLGWCAEVAYAALLHGKFINRGFLNGPVCPIYGFGVLLALYCLRPFMGSWPLLFAGSLVLTSTLELLTGFLLEKIFRQRWWDYSAEPFNLGGYICLRFSIIWGFGCVFVAEILHPTVTALLKLLPVVPGTVLLCVIGAVFAVDLTATVRTILKLRDRQTRIDAAAARMRELSNEFGEGLAIRVMDAAEVGGEWKSELSQRAEAARERRTEAVREGEEHLRAELRGVQERTRRELEERRRSHEERRREAAAELAELRARLEELGKQRVFGQRRLLFAFPKIGAVLREQAERDQ